MRLWAEERRTGTGELLLTFPVRLTTTVFAKFFAAWLFIGLALLLTFPMVISINYLGDPDNGLILASYLGSFLLAGGFLAIGSCLSAATKNQVIAFILSVVTCFLFLLSGFPMVLNFFKLFLPQVLVDAIASTSFLTHYDSITKGVLDLGDFTYFGLTIGLWMYATALIIDMKKAD